MVLGQGLDSDALAEREHGHGLLLDWRVSRERVWVLALVTCVLRADLLFSSSLVGLGLIDFSRLCVDG